MLELIDRYVGDGDSVAVAYFGNSVLYGLAARSDADGFPVVPDGYCDYYHFAVGFVVRSYSAVSRQRSLPAVVDWFADRTAAALGAGDCRLAGHQYGADLTHSDADFALEGVDFALADADSEEPYIVALLAGEQLAGYRASVDYLDVVVDTGDYERVENQDAGVVAEPGDCIVLVDLSVALVVSFPTQIEVNSADAAAD